MQFNIKNGETYRLAKQLAERTGETLTEAVTTALRERLDRQIAADRALAETRAQRLEEMREAAARFDTLPVLDDREPNDILGYDEHGLPS